MWKFAFMITVAYAFAQVAKAQPPIDNLKNIPSSDLSSAAGMRTSDLIQQAASGTSTATSATTAGRAATKVANVGTGISTTNNDVIQTGIQGRTSSAVGNQAAGGTATVNPAYGATTAIRGSQALTSGTNNAEARQQSAGVNTQAAVQSGNAGAATKIGQVTAGRSGNAALPNTQAVGAAAAKVAPKPQGGAGAAPPKAAAKAAPPAKSPVYVTAGSGGVTIPPKSGSGARRMMA